MSQARSNGIYENEDGSVTFVAGTDSYTLLPVSEEQQMADYLAIEAKLRSERVGPIESILPELDKLQAFPELQKKLLDKAYDDLKKGDGERKASQSDIAAWLDTMNGILFSMGLVFRRTYPDLSDARLLTILHHAATGQIKALQAKMIGQIKEVSVAETLASARDAISRDATTAILHG